MTAVGRLSITRTRYLVIWGDGLTADPEYLACCPEQVDQNGFNIQAVLPYGLTPEHIASAMADFIDFLGFVNTQLRTRELPRLETMLMSANFSSMVGEFMGANIPKHCSGLVRNRYHNGHPDLIPADTYPGDAVQYSHEGVEIKASRYLKGWQGHNPEKIFLMVFVFDSSRPSDESKSLAPKPFRFVSVVGAHLNIDDWLFAGRSETSRRTITASVTKSGYRKMMSNWIYRAPGTTTQEIADSLPDPSDLFGSQDPENVI